MKEMLSNNILPKMSDILNVLRSFTNDIPLFKTITFLNIF